jgi:Ca2+-binding EF-hand superfamily protein
MKPEGLRDFEDKGDNWSRYKSKYQPKREATADEARRLMAFAKLVQKADDDAFRKEIGSYLDVEAYLRFLAATAFVSNSDSFFVLGHNYYLYLHPATGRLHFFPWDLDRAFANFPILGSNNQQMNLSFRHPYAGKHRLTERLLAIPGMAERYQQLLKELAAQAFDRDRLLKQVAAAETMTKELLARDAQALARRKDRGTDSGPGGMLGRPPALTTFIVKRTEALAAQLAGESRGHVPSGQLKLGNFLAGPWLEVLDTDKDGKLSKDEWRAIAVKVFETCKKDDRGQVNERGLADALNKMMAKSPADEPKGLAGFLGFSMGGFMAAPIMKRADADKDRKLTRDELINAADKLFNEFDKAQSGQMSEESFGALLSALFPTPNFMALPGGRPSPDSKKK